MTTKCKVTQDWEHDGMLKIENAETLERYAQINNEMNHHHHPEVIWEFSNSKRIIDTLKPLLNEGEKIINFASGGYATPKGFKMMNDYYENMLKRIAEECDPQEVYYEEYNNHESPINWEGDTDAIKMIIDIYGEEVARSIKRFSKHMTIDQLLLKDFHQDGLTFSNGQIPNEIWFSDIDGKAYCHYDNALYPVYLGDIHYKALNDHWKGMSTRYIDGWLKRWSKD